MTSKESPIAEQSPIETIYINNLNDKISLTKLKTSLETLFSKYGTILQITAHKNLKMKGQAFITYESKESSSKAIKELQNYQLFSKPIHISFAKSNSDSYHKLTNNEPQIEERKRRKEETNLKRDLEAKTKKGIKRIKLEDWKSLPRHNILLIQNLSQDYKIDLSDYFGDFDGFINVRLVKVRNLAFIEFDNSELAEKCLKSVDEKDLKEKFGENVIFSFAKK
ncbi:uncharacterized protein J8A68_002366 [[Candida] subhashii]|uniref:RRM domain-containing protein n=1 Tax=[Candida] subhashii TaxID=561895 RepID=A0A8J5UQE1_9ASCO|nr:uncharacterized protein J8A68_002366 [[Candida] subhashii]KAG7664112.1 hypothetical protein J8A68_002366 [[Candida] subhashii]